MTGRFRFAPLDEPAYHVGTVPILSEGRELSS